MAKTFFIVLEESGRTAMMGAHEGLGFKCEISDSTAALKDPEKAPSQGETCS